MLKLPYSDIPDSDGVPAYVWRLLEAFLIGETLDLRGIKVPAAVMATIKRYTKTQPHLDSGLCD